MMNISNLEHFVEQENRMAGLFSKKPKTLSLMNKADRQRIADMIDCSLSPENLTCDGELSRSQVNQKYKYLTRCAQELLSIDPTVKFYEFA
jgi:hypothetical protein